MRFLAEVFDIQGRVVCTDISRRVVGMREAQMRQASTVLAVAGGEEKAAAILGALRTGIVNVLVTGSITTRAVLTLADEHPTPGVCRTAARPAPCTRAKAKPDADPERRAPSCSPRCENWIAWDIRSFLRTLWPMRPTWRPSGSIEGGEAGRGSLVMPGICARRTPVVAVSACARTWNVCLCGIPEEEAATGDPYLAARTMAAEAQLDPEFRRVFDDLQRVSASYVQGGVGTRSAAGRTCSRRELWTSWPTWYRALSGYRLLIARSDRWMPKFAHALTETWSSR